MEIGVFGYSRQVKRADRRGEREEMGIIRRTELTFS